MKELTRLEVQRLLSSELERLGLTRLARMFAVEHNVPRGTHKADVIEAAGGDADTLQGHPASDFALAGHTHPGTITGSYDSGFRALYVSSE